MSPFILVSWWNHCKQSAPIFENKKAWLTSTFFQLYAISNSTDFSVGLILEKLNWHKLKMIQHWIRSLRLKRCIAMVSVHWPLWNEYGDFSSVPICSTLSALKPPSLTHLLSAVQQLCRSIDLYSIQTRVRDSVIYLRRGGHLWGHQTLHSASISHTKESLLYIENLSITEVGCWFYFFSFSLLDNNPLQQSGWSVKALLPGPSWMASVWSFHLSASWHGIIKYSDFK